MNSHFISRLHTFPFCAGESLQRAQGSKHSNAQSLNQGRAAMICDFMYIDAPQVGVDGCSSNANQPTNEIHGDMNLAGKNSHGEH